MLNLDKNSNIKNEISSMLSNSWSDKDNSYIGKTFFNQQGKEYIVTGYFHKKEGNRKLLSILFLESGYETLSTHSHIKNGLIVDRLSPNIANIGCIGYASTKENHREYTVWYNMIARCYDKNCKSYARYGEKGVAVCKRWYRFDHFLEDLPHIDDYNEEKFNNGELELNKDLKQYSLPYNKRIYSLETCTFVTPKENAQYVAPIKKGKNIIATNIETGQKLEFKSLSHFAREFNFPRRTVSTYFKEKK